jgi:hypothetical protein
MKTREIDRIRDRLDRLERDIASASAAWETLRQAGAVQHKPFWPSLMDATDELDRLLLQKSPGEQAGNSA